jgi:carboxypeptidase Taq
MTTYDDLSKHIAEYNDLLNILNLMKWDLRTQMPFGGSETRGQQMETLTTLAKKHFISEKTARLLDATEKEIINEDPDSYRVRSIRQIRKSYELCRRIPSKVMGEIAALEPTAEHVWAEAKKNNDFASFKPYLQKMLDLKRAASDAIGYDEHPLDALIFEYEPGMTVAKLQVLFDDLKKGIIPLLQSIVENDKPLEKDLWQHEYPIEKQRAFAFEMAQKFGYDVNRGRFDIAPHPFEISFTRQDVRITTRYDKNYLPMSLFGTLHETGHALYEQNIAPELTRSALTTDFLGQYAVGGTSYGAHEFASRLWENMVGRSRVFWQNHFSRLQEFFPEQLANTDAEFFYRAVNRVRPSLIRVEADEVTYNLHIMLRVEIEMGLLDGSLRIDDLPEVWNTKMNEYLGIVPPNDGLGVLQDVHWSGGLFGSFLSYTIGNVMSAQFMQAAHADAPTLKSALAGGEYAPLLDWLTQNVFRHGRAYDSTELLQRVTGRELTVKPYLEYLTTKFTDLYNLNG